MRLLNNTIVKTLVAVLAAAAMLVTGIGLTPEANAAGGV